jgi:hypothetical protein
MRELEVLQAAGVRQAMLPLIAITEPIVERAKSKTIAAEMRPIFVFFMSSSV